MIPFDQLVKGNVYKLNSRNLRIGVFDGKKGFIGIRTKFGSRFLDTEIEWDQDQHYGTARAVELIGSIPKEVVLDTSLGVECEYCHKVVNFDKARPEKERWHHTEDDSLICTGKKYGPVSIFNKQLFDLLEGFELHANS